MTCQNRRWSQDYEQKTWLGWYHCGEIKLWVVKIWAVDGCCFVPMSKNSVFDGLRSNLLEGSSIKYVTLFLMIFDPLPPPVTNCHKSWTPPLKVCHTSEQKVNKQISRMETEAGLGGAKPPQMVNLAPLNKIKLAPPKARFSSIEMLNLLIL